jgi:hypothetical protein
MSCMYVSMGSDLSSFCEYNVILPELYAYILRGYGRIDFQSCKASKLDSSMSSSRCFFEVLVVLPAVLRIMLCWVEP